MSNMLMMNYAAKRGENNDGGRGMRMGGYEQRENTYSGGYGGMGNRQPNQYTRRNGMDEDWQEDNGGMEMRRRRRKNGQFMTGGYDDDEREDAMRYERQESRYMPPYGNPPEDGLYDGGGMGFGTRDREYQTRSHYGGDERHGGQQKVQAGGTFWMMPNHQEGEKLDRVTAERWVRGMRNEDSARPSGGKWTMDELKPMAQKFGINPDPEDEKFIEFWVMTNAMYSDYCGVAKKFNIVSPEFYGLMAKAWMEDKDAMPNKTALYYENIVKKNQ